MVASRGALSRSNAQAITLRDEKSDFMERAMGIEPRLQFAKLLIPWGINARWGPKWSTHTEDAFSSQVDSFRIARHLILGRRFKTRTANRRCPVITWVVAPPADSRAHLCGASSRASLCGPPQTSAECRVPTVRQPSPRRRVVRPALSRRTCASQMMGDVTLQRCQ